MNLKALQSELATHNLDAVVAVSPENVVYATGARIVTQKIARDRIAAAILPREGAATFLVCRIEESLVRADSSIQDIRVYKEFQDTPVRVLADLLREKGLRGGRVGIEKRFLCAADFEDLCTADPETTFVEGRGVLEAVRAFKQPHEVALLQKGAQAARKAVESAFLGSTAGDTERQIATRILKNLIDLGADEINFLVLGTGTRSAIAHPIPGETPTVAGQIVREDLGALFQGYHADLARVAAVGKPKPQQADIYRKIMHAHRTVISHMKVGTRFSDLYHECKNLYLSQGLSFSLPHIGHSLGVALHEPPLITPENQDVLKQNLVLNVEHSHVDTEGSAYQVEDLVLIRADGPQVLTGASFSDEIPVIA